MAACERRLGRGARAIALIDRYVKTGGDLVGDEDRREAARWRAALERNVGVVTVTAALAGIDVFIDDEHVGTTPLTSPLLVDAGARRLRFVRRGFHTLSRIEHVEGGALRAWSAESSRIRVRLVSPSERPDAPR